MMKCPNGHDMIRNEALRLWWPCGEPGCDFIDAHPITDQEAAAKQLGPYAPPRNPEPDIPPMEGYAIRVDDGHWFYERIAPGPDDRDVYREGLRAVRALAKRGEW